MKSKLVFTLLFSAISLLPGCYTILVTTNIDEDISFDPGPIMPPDPEPGPIPAPPYPPGPFPPRPPHPKPSPVIVIIKPALTPPSPDKHREIRTERGLLVSNPVPIRNDENNHRNSGVQRGGQTDSNPAPPRNDENSRPTRVPEVQRVRR